MRGLPEQVAGTCAIGPGAFRHSAGDALRCVIDIAGFAILLVAVFALHAPKVHAEVLTHEIRALDVELEPQRDGSVIVTERFEIELNALLDEYRWFVRRLPRMTAAPDAVEILEVDRNDRSEPWTLHNQVYPVALVVGTTYRNALRDTSQSYLLQYRLYEIADSSGKRPTFLWEFQPHDSRFAFTEHAKVTISILGQEGMSLLRAYLRIDKSREIAAKVTAVDGASAARIEPDMTDLVEGRSWVVVARYEPGSFVGENFLEEAYRKTFRSHRVAGALALTAVIGFYALAWHLTHRRMRPFSITTREKLSPALMCFLDRGRFHLQIIDVVVRNLMRKKLLRFDTGPDKTLKIVRGLPQERKEEPSPEERAFFENLFRDGESVVQLDGSARQRVEAANLALRASIENRFQYISIKGNRVWMLFGLAITGCTILALTLYEPNYHLAIEMAWPILPFLVGIGAVAWMSAESWHQCWIGANKRVWASAVFSIVVLLVLAAGLRFFVLRTTEIMGYIAPVLVGLSVVLSGALLFSQYRRVRVGAEARRQIDGMRDRIAESLKAANVAALTEELVPYAMALDRSGKWSWELERWFHERAKKSSDVALNPWYDGGSVNLVDFGSVAHQLPRR